MTVAPSVVNVSILIVSYNTADLTCKCLATVFEQSPELSCEVLVWDNNSPDGSADRIATEFPQVHLTASKENLGFARANNELAKQAHGDWLLLLNPDTEVLDHALERLYAFALEKESNGSDQPLVAGGRTYFADGSLNPWSVWRAPTLWSVTAAALGLAAALPNREWSNPEAYGGWDRGTEREVGFISGCLLLLRRTLWDRLEGFSPDFFMYAEDADLGIRARAMGAHCLICPEARIIHHGGRSEKVVAAATVRLFRAKSQLMRKHWSRPAAWMGRRLLDLWALRRFSTLSVKVLIKPSARPLWREWRNALKRRREWWNP